MDSPKVSQRLREAPAPKILEPKVDLQLAEKFARELGVTDLFARVLVARGFKTPKEATRFFNPSLKEDWEDPFLLPDMQRAVKEIVAAIAAGKKICVFGDYDLDGISATALMVRGLREFGVKPCWILPHRLEDGYGLTESALERIVAKNPDLVITVDTGISAYDSVIKLQELGIDVIVTDHHEPGELIPEGIAVVNPKIDPSYSERKSQLSGAGVALKLMQALGSHMGRPDLWLSLLDLATLGTVADVMPLVGENRALVFEGVKKMQRDPLPGIAALANLTNLPIRQISAERISFSLAPRLNAAGRLGSASDSLYLLLSDDAVEAAHLADILDAHNRKRQEIEAEMMESALAILERTYKGEPAIVLADEAWHEGVKGIVASRLSSIYGVPTILITIEGDEATGSGRSVGEIDLYQAIAACSKHLTRFGGHAGAAGLGLNTDKIELFKAQLIEYMAGLDPELYTHVRKVDALVTIDEVSEEVADELELLRPYGELNPKPIFAARTIELKNAATVGKNAEHLKFHAYQNSTQVSAIYFRAPQIERFVHNEVFVDTVFNIDVSEWHGRRRVQLMISDLRCIDLENCPIGEEPEGYSRFLEELFENADETISRRQDYEGIEDAESFNTKVAGVTFEGRQDLIARLDEGSELSLVRDDHNQYDPNAISVIADEYGRSIGFINKEIAARISPRIDEGQDYGVKLSQVTGGGDKNYGVNVLVYKKTNLKEREAKSLARAKRRAELSALRGPALKDALVKHFLGDGAKLHKAQEETLEKLSYGYSTLSVMATGRGKSLIFQLFACMRAIENGEMSIFVYPLRALISDQAFYLSHVFEEMGLSVVVLNGEVSEARRALIVDDIMAGEIDVVLTTPEFLAIHPNKFKGSRDIGFVVVDEAHHIGQARAGHRPAYATLGDTIAGLGRDSKKPISLAVTATADDEVAGRIIEQLGIEATVLDPSVRENLSLVDVRDHKNAENYLIDLARRGEKMVVYVNSRAESVRIARLLRQVIPSLAWKVAFYNGGLSKAARQVVEKRFRDSEVLITIATSAFGEGVNIPDIRHVVLYHMPFSDIEFNQMSGRAGRDGIPSQIHLLFGHKDVMRNMFMLGSLAPHKASLVAIYQVLRQESHQAGGHEFSITNAEIARRANELVKVSKQRITEEMCSTSIGIFRELGIVETRGRSTARVIQLNQLEQQIPLSSSVRYNEGLDEIESFEDFSDWVNKAPKDTLLSQINKPILPSADTVKGLK